MPSSTTPGSSTSISSRQRCRHRPSPKEQRLGTPKIPAIRFTQGEVFEASTVHTFATACQFARHPVRIWPVSQPTAPFTSKLSSGQSPFPLLDMTTASTGLLCWWDSHPLEWQLASLHAPSAVPFPRPRPTRRSARPLDPARLALVQLDHRSGARPINQSVSERMTEKHWGRALERRLPYPTTSST